MGTKVYELDYTADLEFLDDCMWNGGGNGFGAPFDAIRGRPQNGIGAFAPNVFGKAAANKGQHQTTSGKMIFEKTENGWQVSGG